MGLGRAASGPKTKYPTPVPLLLRLLLPGHGLLRTLPLASVAPGVLAPRRESAPMPQTPVRADLDQPPDVAVDVAPQISLDLEVAVQHLAESADLSLAEV